jgi:hypothetical protein
VANAFSLWLGFCFVLDLQLNTHCIENVASVVQYGFSISLCWNMLSID